MDRDLRLYCRLPRHEPSGQGMVLYRPPGWNTWNARTVARTYPGLALVWVAHLVLLGDKKGSESR